MATRIKQLISHLSGSDMSAELWQDVPLAPPDSIFKLTAAYKADTFKDKVNLGVGAYRDDNNKPWVLPVVKKATAILLNDETLDHEYLPITGLAEYTAAAAKLILGPDSPAIKEDRVVSVQTISGTGANHLGALFLSRFYKFNGPPKVYLSNPTWANHHAIFRNVGIEPVDYAYYDPKTIGLDFEGLLAALRDAPERSVFLLHACAHNPTGVDPTQEQWKAIAEVIAAKKHYSFFDCAYQGFASGDLDKDAWAVRHFVERGLPLLVCQSFAKNAGLYGERVGALHVVSRDKETANRVKSQLSVLQRSEISNPPSHGARLVSLILNSPELFEEWKLDIRTMAGRIIDMRKELHRLLTQVLETPGNWEHITEQIGMFSFTGINGEQSKALVEQAHIYLTANGRISMAGLNSHNIEYVARQLDGVVRGTVSSSAFAQVHCEDATAAQTMTRAPDFIALPPPPVWQDPQPPSDSAPSPAATFYTPPSSPTASPSLFFTPPTSPCLDPPPPIHPIPTDDTFPVPTDLPIDLALDDDGLSTLEKIYLYSRSKASFHRIFITHALPEYLGHVTPQEAVEYVLPLLSNLVVDDEEEVKEALASEFVSIIWWFFTHCQIVPDDPHPEEAYASSSTTVAISVQAFTPILGTLLLSSKAKAYAIIRAAIVKLLLRMKKLDLRESGAYIPPQRHSSDPNLHPWGILPNNRDDDDEDEDAPLPIGLFGTRERSMFTEEILQHVVIGMAQLDMDTDMDIEMEGAAGLSPPPALSSPPTSPRSREYDNSNPYFPPIPQPLSANTSSSLPGSSRSSSSGSGNGYSSNTEIPATSRSHSVSPSRPGALNFGPAATSHLAASGPGVATEIDDRWEELADQEEPSEAAGGRLSSMSLIASIVSSVAPLDRETLVSLISEVQRVVKDPVVWVRRECSFALGALAKVIPDDLITSTLLPIFDDVRWDAVWAVRHSALYALPAILARLSPAQRRMLALETIVALSADQHPVVRRGALEALGEVIYTFKADATGPPEELVHLFMGQKEDRRVRDGQQEQDQNPEPPKDAREAFFTDPQRPLICAFNFPAVVLTLGPDRWAEVRHFYLDLADNQNDRVRATLAASAGVLAKLIGADNARSDVVDFWWTAFRCGSATIRGNALESLPDLLDAVGPQVGRSLVSDLIKEWKGLRNYRERDFIQQKLSSWELWNTDARVELYELVMLGVEDDTAAVREAAIANIPLALSRCSSVKEVLQDFYGRLKQLGSSSSSRSRITFIDCQQRLILGADAAHSLVSLDDDIIRSVANLANDDIEGVRIRVARLAAVVYRTLLRQSRPILVPLDELVRTLSQDVSPGVRRYVADLSPRELGVSMAIPPSKSGQKRLLQAATFSRPPASSRSVSHVTAQGDLSSQVFSSSGGANPITSRHISGDEDGSFDTQLASSHSSWTQTPLGTAPGGDRNSVLVNRIYSPALGGNTDEPYSYDFQGANESVTVPG